MTLEEKIDDIQKQLKVKGKKYNIITLILSILDFVAGILCVIFSSIQIAAGVVGIISGAIGANKVVQLLRARNFIKSIALINGISATYIIARVKKGEYMKNWLKANKFSILESIFFAGIIGTATWFLIAAYVVLPLWASILIAIGAGIVAMILVYFLGAEKVWQYSLRIISKQLPQDQIDTLTNTANEFLTTIKAEKQKEQERIKEEQEIQKAKNIIEEYENAKKILEKQNIQG